LILPPFYGRYFLTVSKGTWAEHRKAEDLEPYANLTENIFAMVAEGSLSAVLPIVSVTELLVQLSLFPDPIT
jgi:hypothetical protein